MASLKIKRGTNSLGGEQFHRLEKVAKSAGSIPSKGQSLRRTGNEGQNGACTSSTKISVGAQRRVSAFPGEFLVLASGKLN